MISLKVALKSLLRSVLRVEFAMTVSSTNATTPRSATPFLGMALLLLTGLPFPAFSQSPTIHATIDASKTGTPISKYIYGQFLEHGGDIVNTGVWSEMLVDRKFFYPVAASAPTPPALMSNAGGNPRQRRTPTRWWAPVGGDQAVSMDEKAPYSGEQSPLVKLGGKESRGISQSGIAVRKGKVYTGRIALAGSSSAVIKVTLIWGKEGSDRETVTIHALSAGYRKFSLRYTVVADTDPTFTYYFTWQSPIFDGLPGAWHTADLQFCFDNTKRCEQGTGNTPEAQILAKNMAASWASFAATGDPSIPGLKWPATDPETNRTMIWDNERRMADDPEAEARKIILT